MSKALLKSRETVIPTDYFKRTKPKKCLLVVILFASQDIGTVACEVNDDLFHSI